MRQPGSLGGAGGIASGDEAEGEALAGSVTSFGGSAGAPASDGLTLIVSADEGATSFRVPIEGEGPFFIGRGPDAKLKIDAPGVADLHAKIVWTPEGWRVRDLGSAKGTLLNGALIVDAPIAPGDVIGVGAAIVRVEKPRSRVRVVLASPSPAPPPNVPRQATTGERGALLAAGAGPGASPVPAPVSVAVRLDPLAPDLTRTLERVPAPGTSFDPRVGALVPVLAALRQVRRRDAVFERVLLAAADLLLPDRALLLLPDKTSGRFERAHGAGPRADADIAPNRTAIGQAVSDRAAVLVADAGDPRSRSVACAPLLRNGRAEAVLYADRLGGRTFDGSDLAFLMLLATQAAAHLDEVARLEGLERELAARSGDARRRADEVRDLAAERDEIKAAVAEVLRAPLEALREPLEAAVDGIEALADRSAAGERLRSQAARAAAAARDIESAVEDLVAAPAAEPAEPASAAEPVVLSRAVGEVVRSDEVAPVALRVRIEVEVAGDLRVLADPRRARRALKHLLLDAARTARAGGRIVVGAADDGDAVRVDVTDRGQGIPAEELERMLRKFDRSVARKAGSLHVAAARRLAESMGGRLEALAAPGVGSRVSMWLPRAT